MRDLFKAVLVAGVLVGVFALTVVAAPVLPGAGGWTDAWMATPPSTDLVSAGWQEIQNVRGAVHERATVETQWGPDSGTSTDDGRHRAGSARAFTNADCATVAALEELDLSGSGALDAGRICFDTTASDGRVFYNDGAGSWVRGGGFANIVDYNEEAGTAWVSGAGATAYEPAGVAYTVTVTCPHSNYYIVFEALLNLETTGVTSGSFIVQENIAAAGWANVGSQYAYDSAFGVVATHWDQLSLMYVNSSPTAGATHAYRVMGLDTAGAIRSNCLANATGACASHFLAECRPN
jgi:hypothetical protein